MDQHGRVQQDRFDRRVNVLVHGELGDGGHQRHVLIGNVCANIDDAPDQGNGRQRFFPAGQRVGPVEGQQPHFI